MKRSAVLAVAIAVSLGALALEAAAGFTPGSILVANTPSSRSGGPDYIDQYSRDGAYLDTRIGPELDIEGIRDLAYDALTGHLFYTVNTWTPRVFEVREIDSDGSLTRTYTHPEFGSGNIELAFGGDHTLYAANNGYIFRRPAGETAFTRFCTLPDTPSVGIGDLEIGAGNALYLSDPFVTDKIYRISQDGGVEVFADAGDGLNDPYGIAMGPDGNLYACNGHGSDHSVIRISPDGRGEVFVPNGRLPSTAHDLAFDSRGTLLAACRNTHDIFRIETDGSISDFIVPDDRAGISDPASFAPIPGPASPVPAVAPRVLLLAALLLAGLGGASLGRGKTGIRFIAAAVVPAALFFAPGSGFAAGPVLIDHNCTDITAIPRAAIEQAKAGLHIAYGHTSHGSQLTTGMTGLVNVANAKVLYDFADIESYDPDGTYYEFPHDNCDYYASATGPRLGNWALERQASHTEGTDWYACSSAHSQALNANLKAYAAWWLWARLGGWTPRAHAVPAVTPAVLPLVVLMAAGIGIAGISRAGRGDPGA